MKITIAYLYHDLLNLYGDNGNIKALYNHLKEQGIKVELKCLSIGDKKEFNKYDLVYIGSGTDKNLLLALSDLLKYKSEIKKAIKDNRFFLSTGNSLEMFGKEIIINNEVHKALDILNFYTTYENKRIVNDVIYDNYMIDDKIIGFENHRGKIVTKEKKLFDNEGVTKNNFMGTYIIGPLLIRNPKFCEYYVKSLILSKDKDFNFKNSNYKLENLAYKKNIESIIS